METKSSVSIMLNGTDSNPYKKYGLQQNPFATHPALAKLAAEPIPHNRYEQYIRDVLEGFSEEFVNLCVRNFKRGHLVKFIVNW